MAAQQIANGPFAQTKDKILTIVQLNKDGVFICPGRLLGAVPMKLTRISLGLISSVFGSQLTAIFCQGWGSMPSN